MVFRIVVVGFSTKVEKAVYYQKKAIPWPEAPTVVEAEIQYQEDLRRVGGQLLLSAKKAGSQFVSVRFIE